MLNKHLWSSHKSIFLFCRLHTVRVIELQDMDIFSLLVLYVLIYTFKCVISLEIMVKDDWFGLSIQCLCITLNVWQAGISCIASYLPNGACGL